MILEKIIKRNDNKIAYKINNEHISYKELIEKAKIYGELLKRQGIGPVIIYGHKSVEMFISIFACLYAERAYIPIDLCTPNERIKKIISLSKSDLIIKNESINIDAVECLKLDELVKYKDYSVLNIINDISYIIFTSGSTGEPKGVPISRDNLLNFIDWIGKIQPLSTYHDINVLNQASFSFDLSVADIYYAISNGHTLVALDKESQENYNDIFDKVNDNTINLLVVTPTFIKLCLVNKEFNYKNYSSIKCIYFCGEQLEVRTVKELFERFPNIKIINAYGPTEATSAISAISITKDMLNNNLLPVGEMDNLATDVYINDGEIILKGKSVFGGYLGNFAGGYYIENNINCFKTGDYGYIKDKKLYCKGRKDSQIKYKGYRIELTDIENNLYKINGVKECAVVAKYQGDYIVKLIKAFVVLEEGIDVEYVKQQLKEYLPIYMIPKIIVKLESLPINNNGKIDRKKLSEL